jgi:uncharacterized iron-regulated membrane protein
VFGWPLKIFNCLIGLTVVGLSITGVLVWLRKRRSGRRTLPAGNLVKTGAEGA